MSVMNFEQTRRTFLTRLMGSVAGMGAVSAAPWVLPVTESALAADGAGLGEKVRVGMIGVGSRGRYLTQQIQQSTNLQVVAICDNYELNYERAIALTEGKATAYRDYKALLDAGGIDAVVIATPLAHHDYITIDALQAGYHVFCEKAMARTLDGCKAMVDAHLATGRVLQIGHQRLFDPVYLEALKHVQAGDIGKITQIRAYWHRHDDWRRPVPAGSGLERHINWRLYKDSSAGLMTELASHQIQVANWFYGSVPERVMGSGSISYWKDGREVYDQVALIYDYSDGRKLLYDSMTNNRLYGIEEQILGDLGTIEPETNRLYSETPEPVPALQRLMADITDGVFGTVPIGGPSWKAETRLDNKGKTIVPGEYNEGLLQLEAFADSVKSGKPLPGLLREGYHASIGALLGEMAMDSGKAVSWPSRYIMPA